MAMTGLQIHKLLPRTNCKECGSNTCMAFAMKLAAKKVELSACPYLSEEAQQVLGAASEPPVREVVLGAGNAVRLGAETVLYRHEKTFVNPTALAVNINCDAPGEEIEATLASVRDYRLERVGETMRLDMVAISQHRGTAAAFAAVARQAWENAHKPLVLRSTDAEALTAAAAAVSGSRSLLAAATPETAEVLCQAAAEHGHALAVTAPDLDRLVATTQKLKADGFDDLVLQFQVHSPAEHYQTNVLARRLALQHGFKPLGYPVLRFLNGEDVLDDAVTAVTEITKYGSICVLPGFDPALISALMTLRMNIYTDPQKPIQVEPNVYPLGNPDAESPVLVTTNFSLTYFIVAGEIENSGTSAWLVVPECEGMSVLTAWAAGKFSAESIAGFVRECGLEDKVDRRELIIPGIVAQLSGELEEQLPGWQVIVGPQEAADLESFFSAHG